MGSTSNDAGSWNLVNGEWPAYCELLTNHWRFGGQIDAVGSVNSGVSDERLKLIKGVIPNPVEKLMAIDGIVYGWDMEACKAAGFTPSADYLEEMVGFRAQQVQAQLPSATPIAPFDRVLNQETLVHEPKSGENYLTVREENVVPLVVEGFKNHERRMRKLEDEIEELRSLFNKKAA